MSGVQDTCPLTDCSMPFHLANGRGCKGINPVRNFPTDVVLLRMSEDDMKQC